MTHKVLARAATTNLLELVSHLDQLTTTDLQDTLRRDLLDTANRTKNCKTVNVGQQTAAVKNILPTLFRKSTIFRIEHSDGFTEHTVEGTGLNAIEGIVPTLATYALCDERPKTFNLASKDPIANMEQTHRKNLTAAIIAHRAPSF